MSLSFYFNWKHIYSIRFIRHTVVTAATSPLNNGMSVNRCVVLIAIQTHANTFRSSAPPLLSEKDLILEGPGDPVDDEASIIAE